MRTSLRRALFLCTILLIVSVGCAQPDATPSGRTAHQAVLAYLGGTDRSYVVRAEIADRALAAESLSGFVFDLDDDSHTSEVFGDARVQLLDKYDYLAMFSKGCREGWAAFHSRYPDAGMLLGLSKTGRAERGARFAVYVEIGAGCLDGRGRVYYPEQERGRWHVIEARNVWES